MNLLFRIRTDQLVCPPIEVNAHTTETLSNGMIKEVYLRYFEPNLYVTMEALKDPAYAVTKYTAILHNGLDRPVRLYQLDAGVAVPADDVTVRYFSGGFLFESCQKLCRYFLRGVYATAGPRARRFFLKK